MCLSVQARGPAEAALPGPLGSVLPGRQFLGERKDIFAREGRLTEIKIG